MSTDVKTMNRKVFKAGMKKSHRIIHTHVQDILSSACERLLADAEIGRASCRERV